MYLVRIPNPAEHLIGGVGYDRSCDFHPFLKNLSINGNVIANNYLKLSYMVDIFHINKHTEPKCVLGNELCEYHPHLPKFDHLRGMNTEIAEQSFKEINPFKCTTRKMTYAKRWLFLKFIDHSYNLNIA